MWRERGLGWEQERDGDEGQAVAGSDESSVRVGAVADVAGQE